MMELKKHLFDLEEGSHYLNAAYMAPLLKSVAATGKKQVDAKLRPYRISGNDFFNDVAELKQEFAKLINAPSSDQIAIIPSVSYGIANVVKNINVEGKEIILAAEQFPSNVYPWLELEKAQQAKVNIIGAPDTLTERGKKWNENILNAINSNTGLVAISQVHWADGTLFDLIEIRKKTKEMGALLIIDGTQSVGAFPFNVQEIKPDALTCAGYKWLMGSYGIGVAYYGATFANGTPIEHNWINRKGSENFSELVNYQDEYQPGAMRYSVGEQSNFILVPMLLESLKQLNAWGVENIQVYCKSITEKPVKKLQEKGYWVEEPAYRASHLFGIRKEGMEVEKIKEQLEKHQIYVSIRGSSIRVSPHVYNSESDMMKLVDILN